ncbi:DUF6174 domain-containing protein [Shewanella loihica]|uniref:Uncharacterized protein n=1 Tax=Shewanella loihica (strain ATCC BAA-1088 / PV-4) TaxID=323850 RepID=A3QIZ3_SHELP|nr:DUF6174 domain-containing protein [Shewanella loihica]ABO25441.1 hypothetical protein Shew_3575 [Shewanella loihica PV-4]
MQIFDTRNPYSIFFVLGTIIVLIFSFWGIGHQSVNSQTHEKIASQLEIWQQNEPERYSYVAQEGCMYVVGSKVLVANGVALFEKLGEHEHKLVIDDLFKAANKGLFEAASMEIKYHPKFGFPEVIEVDWSKDTIDDECFYEISKFKVLE